MNRTKQTNLSILLGSSLVIPTVHQPGKIRVKLFRAIKGRIALIVMLVSLATPWCSFVSDENTAGAAEASSDSLQEQGNDLMKNLEEMVAHGGMGDGKAIVHHCGEATRIAESIIKRIPLTEPHRGDAITSLNEMIRLCHRVSDIGIHADPGQLLNPATKARAAAQESMKSLGLTRANKG